MKATLRKLNFLKVAFTNLGRHEDETPGRIRGGAGTRPGPLEELLTSLSFCLTELSPGHVVLTEAGDAYDPL